MGENLFTYSSKVQHRGRVSGILHLYHPGQTKRDHRNCFEIGVERQAWWAGGMTITVLNCRILKRQCKIKRNKDGSKASSIEKWENWKSWKTIQNVNVLFLNVLNLTWRWDIKHEYSVFIEHSWNTHICDHVHWHRIKNGNTWHFSWSSHFDRNKGAGNCW